MAKRLIVQFADALRRIEEQEAWIQQCGGNVLGYIANYGAENDPNKHGDGGRRIYVADMAELRKRQLVLASVRTKLARQMNREIASKGPFVSPFED